MSIFNTAVLNSAKPKACLFCSFGARTCGSGSAQACSVKSKRTVSHDQNDQLTYAEQVAFLRSNKDVIDLIKTHGAKDAIRRIFQYKMLGEADKM